MKPLRLSLICFFAILLYGSQINAQQIDDICGEFGHIATLAAPRLTAPFVYGKVYITGSDPEGPAPRVTVIYSNRGQSPERITLGRTGNYCFRLTSGAGGLLTVEMDGVEMSRRQVSNFGTAQQREDFDISLKPKENLSSIGVISAKFYHPPNERTTPLYEQAFSAEKQGSLDQAVKLVKEIVAIDKDDFIAWAYLGNLLLEQKKFDDADAAFKTSLTLKIEYTPAWINVGRLRIAQKMYDAAIEIFKYSIELEPGSARIHQLLGEAYLLNKMGSLGAEALNTAIELDPMGMAELHLQLAHLYQLAGAKSEASREYKLFLSKMPDHPDAEKFKKFIADNP